MQFESLNHFKLVSANRFFVRPADENYILARWMLINGFHREFFWQALQAIEKYLKAGLVLQDLSVRNYSHKIDKLYSDHRKAYNDLAISVFEKPPELTSHIWQNSTPETFVSRVNRVGNSASRYGMRGWWREPDDLFKFDQLCGALRRLVVGLNWVVGHDFTLEPEQEVHRGKTYADALKDDHRFQPLSEMANLDRRLAACGETRREMLHAWNFTYRRSPADFEKHAPGTLAPNFGPLENTYLFLYIEALSETDKQGRPRQHSPDFLNGLKWLTEKFKLDPDVQKLIDEGVSNARVQSNLSVGTA